jgi:hypothetical protein
MSDQSLEIRLALLEDATKRDEARIKDLEERVAALRTFQTTVLVTFASIAAIVGFFSSWIQKNIFGMK